MSYSRARELAQMLTGVGVPAAADPRNLPVPGVLVTPPRLDYTTMCGGTASWLLLAVVPGPFNADAWKALDALIDQVTAVLPVTDAQPGSTDDTQPNPNPCYELRFEEAF